VYDENGMKLVDFKIDGRAKWNDRLTQKYHWKVATLMEDILNELYEHLSDSVVLKEECEKLCRRISSIPHSFISKEDHTVNKKKDMREKKKSGSAFKEERVRDRPRSIYDGEMTTQEDRKKREEKFTQERWRADRKGKHSGDDQERSSRAEISIQSGNIFKHLALRGDSLTETVSSSSLSSSYSLSSSPSSSLSSSSFYSSPPIISSTSSSSSSSVCTSSVPSSSHSLSLEENQKFFIEGLIRRGKIGDATERLKEFTCHGTPQYSPSSVATKLQQMHENYEQQFEKSIKGHSHSLSHLSSSHTPSSLERHRAGMITDQFESKIIESDQDFSSLLNTLDPSSSCGADGWSVSLLKKVVSDRPVCLTLLRVCINYMMLLQWYPDIWFSDRIIGIPKPGKPDETRPITITNLFRKIISKSLLLLYRPQLLSLLPSHQYGVGFSC
jgi:hypothetical protein